MEKQKVVNRELINYLNENYINGKMSIKEIADNFNLSVGGVKTLCIDTK